jgi:lipopolysaccharide export system ATP-binding protein
LSLIIQTKDLVKKYGSRTVVNHVSFNVKQGEIVGLLGPNGAGKTTSFYQVVGLVKPDEGEVFLNDMNITKMPMYKRAQLGIGYLPQEASVFRKLSVEDNIKAVLEMTKLSHQQQSEKLESLLNEFNLQLVRKNNGDTLSGGERRRTEIARALAVDPKFILLDEPFAGVDPIAVEDIQTIVARLKFKNIGILITDHNVNETLSICDRAYLLIDGKIFKHGTAEELADDEQVRRLYLGRNFELKRKDYLHEEAEKNSTTEEVVTIKKENAGSSLISFTEYVIGQTDLAIKVFNDMAVAGSEIDSETNIDFKEYFNSYNELKTSLKAEIERTGDIPLKQAMDELPSLEYKKYARIFNIQDSNVLSGFLWRILLSFTIKPLVAKLHAAKSPLGKIALELKITVNS